MSKRQEPLQTQIFASFLGCFFLPRWTMKLSVPKKLKPLLRRPSLGRVGFTSLLNTSCIQPPASQFTFKKWPNPQPRSAIISGHYLHIEYYISTLRDFFRGRTPWHAVMMQFIQDISECFRLIFVEVGNINEKMTQQKIRCFHTSWCSLLFLHDFYYLRKIILGKWNEEKQAGHVSKTLRILPGKDHGFLSYFYGKGHIRDWLQGCELPNLKIWRYSLGWIVGTQQPVCSICRICYRIGFFQKINQISNIQDFWLFDGSRKY